VILRKNQSGYRLARKAPTLPFYEGFLTYSYSRYNTKIAEVVREMWGLSGEMNIIEGGDHDEHKN